MTRERCAICEWQEADRRIKIQSGTRTRVVQACPACAGRYGLGKSSPLVSLKQALLRSYVHEVNKLDTHFRIRRTKS